MQNVVMICITGTLKREELVLASVKKIRRKILRQIAAPLINLSNEILLKDGTVSVERRN